MTADRSAGRELVTVVVPTTGRPELARAVAGVRRQSGGVRWEMVIVVDGGVRDLPVVDGLPRDARVRVVHTGDRLGGGAARNLGVAAAEGTWIAFLDDDDEWHPGKLARQVRTGAAARARDRWPLVSSRVVQRFAGRSGVVTGVPARLYDPSTTPAEYLFLARRPGTRRASLFTSTLLADARLCRAVPWDPGLGRHQDWDWVIRAGSRPEMVLLHHPDDLATIQVGSADSISARPDWSQSLQWALRRLGGSDAVLVDFLIAQTLRYALHARDGEGVASVLTEVRRRHRLPHLGPILAAMGGVLPRPRTEALMTVVR